MQFPKELFDLALAVKQKGGKISNDDWADILSNLKKALHPHMSQIANKPLGDIKLLDCSSGNTIKNEIKPDNSNCDCGSFIALRTPGLWLPAILMLKTDKTKLDCIFIWGITRDDDWTLVKIDAHIFRDDARNPDPKIIHDFYIDFMKTTFSCPSEICQDCGITYEQMYQQILKAVSDWAQRRRKLADDAESFNSRLKIIDAILRGQ